MILPPGKVDFRVESPVVAQPSAYNFQALALCSTPLNDRVGRIIEFTDWLRAELIRFEAPHPPPHTLSEAEERRRVLRKQLLGALGLDPLPERTPLNARVLGCIEKDDYTIEKVAFESRPNHVIPALLYLPKPNMGKVPAIVSAIGHWSHGKSSKAPQRRAIGLVKRGYAVLAVEACYAYERGIPGNTEGFEPLVAGGCVAGHMVWDIMRAVDYLETRPDIDASRLGITGASGGGLQTFYAGAVDERFDVVMPAVALWPMHELAVNAYYSADNWVPGISRLVGMSALIALTAPRGMLVMNMDQDYATSYACEVMVNAARPYYTLLGAENRLLHTMSGPESIQGRADLPMPKHFHDEDVYFGTLWKRITRYADVFAVRANDFSYANFSGRDWRELEPEYAQYERPILAHEVGIIGTYLDLSLESRYKGSLPADLYKAAREYLEKTGRAAMAKTYFENSARWHGQARKFVLENLRKTPSMDGYDLLGGIDSHWHNSGYGCGLLNEFLEFKPGDTLERVLQYNGESVILLDHAKRFVFRAGDHFDAPILVSLFGGKDLENGTLNWEVCEGDTVNVQGELRNLSAHDGCVTTLGSVQFTWPRLDSSKHLVLTVKLTDPTYQIANQWDFWVFSEHAPAPTHAEADAEALALLGERYSDIRPIGTNPTCTLRIVRSLTEPDLEYLASGGDILLLGTKPFPANETRYLMGVAGRAHMNLATVIRSHPVFKYLPHDGWCDWQFKDLLDYGACVSNSANFLCRSIPSWKW
ncbi:MAG TPA: acetylxylan esterase [Candidatus Hydrogenedentes bacterium]|nr:acetylxylan esterase [Candidatus Hydrogenedentota bacterium]HOL77498.1 acetylxylan esterase [Candidatus Hydrogenedentota bacterium]HPO86255.1 acetylxylan esterase [Candidatus Hydrogenedentota bacterium]